MQCIFRCNKFFLKKEITVAKTYEEAIHKGLRGAIVTTLKYGIPGLLLIAALLFGLNWIFGWVAAPFAWIGGAADSTGSAIGAAWDYLPDWVPGADDANAPPAPEPEPVAAPAEVPAEADDGEPGPICSRWTTLNPFCD